MAQINVFRLRKTYTDSTTGFLEQLCEELRDLSNNCDDILEHTEIVVVPDEALIPWSQYKHQDAYDPELEGLVNDELEYQRSQRSEMTVSMPMKWAPRKDDVKTWELRFGSVVVARIRPRLSLSSFRNDLEAVYYHEGVEYFLSDYHSLQDAMDGVVEYLTNRAEEED